MFNEVSINAIRGHQKSALEIAQELNKNPEDRSRELSLAITKIEESLMWLQADLDNKLKSVAEGPI